MIITLLLITAGNHEIFDLNNFSLQTFIIQYDSRHIFLELTETSERLAALVSELVGQREIELISLTHLLGGTLVTYHKPTSTSPYILPDLRNLA